MRKPETSLDWTHDGLRAVVLEPWSDVSWPVRHLRSARGSRLPVESCITTPFSVLDVATTMGKQIHQEKPASLESFGEVHVTNFGPPGNGTQKKGRAITLEMDSLTAECIYNDDVKSLRFRPQRMAKSKCLFCFRWPLLNLYIINQHLVSMNAYLSSTPSQIGRWHLTCTCRWRLLLNSRLLLASVFALRLMTLCARSLAPCSAHLPSHDCTQTLRIHNNEFSRNADTYSSWRPHKSSTSRPSIASKSTDCSSC